MLWRAMLKRISSLFTGKEPEPETPRPPSAVPAGQRVYAIGDIHGRLDLLDALIAAIEADDAGRGQAQTTVLLLGDLVDRGPDSAGVIDRARRLRAAPGAGRTVRILYGNHEEMFVRSFDDLEMLRPFLRHGGRETLYSYGVDKQALTEADLEQAQALMQAAVPQADRDFIATFEDMITIGDYAFVHAGVDPLASLAQQRASTLRWIREPFLSFEGDFGKVVVHGHTITPDAVLRANRIGLDTGAYASGRLTALALEGTERRLIETHTDENGAISITSCVG
jgi:serine/threonine protein phosphatase 1